MVKDKRFDGLFLLPAAQTRDKNAVSPKQMQDLCKELKEQFDYILIDCPAGIEQGFKNAVAGADKAIVVTIPKYQLSEMQIGLSVYWPLMIFIIPTSYQSVANRYG